MFLLVAGNPAELRSLEQHFLHAGVPKSQIRGVTYEGLGELPGDDVPDFPVIMVAMSTAVEGWQQMALRLKKLAPLSYLTCAYLGNPSEVHLEGLTRKAAEVGGALTIITEIDPHRTRANIAALQRHLAPTT